MAKGDESAKSPEEMAYKAGYALPSVNWPEDATDEQRQPGMHHCPFNPDLPEQADEAQAWAKGLRDALGRPVKDPAEVIAELDAVIGDS